MRFFDAVLIGSLTLGSGGIRLECDRAVISSSILLLSRGGQGTWGFVIRVVSYRTDA